jgi:hypothetical protein
MALEENPFQPKVVDPVPRRHGDRFHVLRGGFDEVQVTIRVKGIDDRTLAPMVVNLDTGFGVAFTGPVSGGQELRFESDGRVTLEGASVARLSYSFLGGVFGDRTRAHNRDFVFADQDSLEQYGDREGTFAVTAPVADAFEPTAVFPHAEGLLGAATMSVGESRWAFFVSVGHFGMHPAGGDDRFAVPLFDAGRFDRSAFAAVAGEQPDPAAEVGFAWQEREPFAATLWVPQRFEALDVNGEMPVRERLRGLLDRHRSAGVHVYVKYADDRWSLSTGILRELGSTDPRGLVVAGTRLWPDGTPQPPPN